MYENRNKGKFFNLFEVTTCTAIKLAIKKENTFFQLLSIFYKPNIQVNIRQSEFNNNLGQDIFISA